MVQCDCNYLSVIIWLLGNELGYGVNYDVLYCWIKFVDFFCLVQYEGGGVDIMVIDIICLMYVCVDEDQFFLVVLKWFIKKWFLLFGEMCLLIFCEYVYVMGNSFGGFVKYWQVFCQYFCLQGGFVWDWVDQLLIKYDENGNLWLVYGGDFGDMLNDCQFCMNGLVFVDRTLYLVLMEVKYQQQFFQFRLFG